MRSVNKSNANTLLDVFGSISNVLQADEQQLLLCPGLGGKRAHRLWAAFNEPFRGQGQGKRKLLVQAQAQVCLCTKCLPAPSLLPACNLHLLLEQLLVRRLHAHLRTNPPPNYRHNCRYRRRLQAKEGQEGQEG